MAAAALGLAVLAPQAMAGTPITMSGLLDTGVYATTRDPGTNGVNFGQLFTDKHDQLVLNQAMLTLQKGLDSSAKSFNWGFNLQGFYGSDARYPHVIGMWDHNTSDRNQWMLTNANVQAHLPIIGEGGMDVTLGLFATPIGVEVIPANGNYFYSHNYIFNFGLPFEQTGLLTVTHVNSTLDVYLGVDSGLNTSYGTRGDNNNSMSGTAGFGLNNLDNGKLTVIGLSHFGAENALLRGTQPNGIANAGDYIRYLIDINATYKPNSLWTFITELNYLHDNYAHAKAGGVSETAAYAVNDWLTLAGRAEIYADPEGYAVAGFPSNTGFVEFERGTSPAPVVLGPGQATTYGELTLGAQIKLPGMPKMISGAMLRPEIRFDRSMSGNNAFYYNSANVPTANSQISAGMDLVVPVSFF
jgi:hypothetical protein